MDKIPAETLEQIIERRKKNGYIVVIANDAIREGYLCFKCDTHSRAPRPVSFSFLTVMGNGEIKDIGFAMTQNSWREILIESMRDIL